MFFKFAKSLDEWLVADASISIIDTRYSASQAKIDGNDMVIVRFMCNEAIWKNYIRYLYGDMNKIKYLMSVYNV